MEPTSSGLDENVAAALTYLFGWISGAVFLATEPANKFVRFHAWQSVIVFGGLSILWFIAVSSIVLWILALVVIPPLSAIVWLFMMFKAYQGERYKLPYAGDMAERRA